MTALIVLQHVHDLQHGLHLSRLSPGGVRFADRAAAGRPDDRPRPAGRDDAAERRRRGRGPRLQRRPRLDRPVRGDDERARRASSGSSTRTIRRRSGSTRPATTRPPRTSSSSPSTTSATRKFFAHTVDQSSAVLKTGPVRYVTNLNTLVGTVPWITGVKTGHTNGAGYVLVASGHKDGMTLISAVLGTDSETARSANAMALMNYGYGNFRTWTPLRAHQVVAHPAVKDRSGLHVPVYAARAFTRVLARDSHVRIRVDVPGAARRPAAARRGRRLGQGGRRRSCDQVGSGRAAADPAGGERADAGGSHRHQAADAGADRDRRGARCDRVVARARGAAPRPARVPGPAGRTRDSEWEVA